MARKEKLKDHIQIRIQKLNLESLFIGIAIAVCLYLFIFVICLLPEVHAKTLFKNIYFIGPFWLFLLSGNSYGYLKEKKNAQHSRSVNNQGLGI